MGFDNRRRPPIREKKNQHRINNEIKSPEVRLIDEEKEQLGILPIREALRIASIPSSILDSFSVLVLLKILIRTRSESSFETSGFKSCVSCLTCFLVNLFVSHIFIPPIMYFDLINKSMV